MPPKPQHPTPRPVLTRLFLHHVVLHLSAARDIASFILVSKRCQQTVLFAQEFPASHTPFPKLLRLFPNASLLTIDMYALAPQIPLISSAFQINLTVNHGVRLLPKLTPLFPNILSFSIPSSPTPTDLSFLPQLVALTKLSLPLALLPSTTPFLPVSILTRLRILHLTAISDDSPLLLHTPTLASLTLTLVLHYLVTPTLLHTFPITTFRFTSSPQNFSPSFFLEAPVTTTTLDPPGVYTTISKNHFGLLSLDTSKAFPKLIPPLQCLTLVGRYPVSLEKATSLLSLSIRLSTAQPLHKYNLQGLTNLTALSLLSDKPQNRIVILPSSLRALDCRNFLDRYTNIHHGACCLRSLDINSIQDTSVTFPTSLLSLAVTAVRLTQINDRDLRSLTRLRLSKLRLARLVLKRPAAVTLEHCTLLRPVEWFAGAGTLSVTPHR